MGSLCPHCKNPVVPWQPHLTLSGDVDLYDMHNWDSEYKRCPLCRICKGKVYSERVVLCDCPHCLDMQRRWAKEAYDASPEGIAEAEEKRKIAAAEAEEKRIRDAEKAREDRDAEKARKDRYSEMRKQRDDELAASRRAPKKGKGKKYESKPKGKNKRR